MMKLRGKFGATVRFVSALVVPVLAFALLADTAIAQSASDFRLPEPTPTSTTRAPGPVDPENPGASTPGTAPSPAPTPTRTASPSPAPTASAAAAPAPAAGRSPARSVPGAAPRAAPAAAPGAASPAPVLATPVAESGAPPSTFPPAASGPIGTSGSAVPSFPSLTPDAAVPPADQGAAWWWPYLAGGSTALAALFGLLWWRRRSETQDPVAEFEMPVVRAPMPALAPAPAPAIPEPRLSAAAPPAPIAEPDRLTLTLEATRLNASLMATTLSYRLKLTNHGTGVLVGLAIEGDMISAHASLPPEQQIAQAGQALELRHALATLAAGESAEFSGEIRLPLSAITPIRAGEQAYFVPLARFRVEAGGPGEDPFFLARTFVVGDVPEGPQTTLRPFRLDLGPRTYSRVSQREVN